MKIVFTLTPFCFRSLYSLLNSKAYSKIHAVMIILYNNLFEIIPRQRIIIVSFYF